MPEIITALLQFTHALEKSISEENVDVRLMYRIRGYSKHFPSELLQPLDTIFNRFDDWDAQSADGFCLAEMEKLLGLIEGIIQSSLHAQTPMEQDVTGDLTPHFTLNSDDKKRVLELCADIRKIVLATDVFDQAHTRRLLDRISAMEKEIHQPKGRLDVILGGVSDFGETLGKFGGDIKPLTDRIKEIAQITRKGTKEYDQIPAPEDIKQLPKPDAEDDSE